MLREADCTEEEAEQNGSCAPADSSFRGQIHYGEHADCGRFGRQALKQPGNGENDRIDDLAIGHDDFDGASEAGSTGAPQELPNSNACSTF